MREGDRRAAQFSVHAMPLIVAQEFEVPHEPVAIHDLTTLDPKV